MKWRYQPVLVEDDGERCYGLCEVYFSDEDTLESWTEEFAVAPHGNDIEDLSGELTHMIVDALSFEPVAFTDLKAGMRFTRRVSMEDRIALADFVDETADSFKRMPKPAPN